MKLPLVAADHSVLHERARLVQGSPSETFIADLWETLHAHAGLGLAAPQVGLAIRVAIVLVSGVSRVLVNPVILWQSQATEAALERCLSLPGIEISVRRPLA